jgi:hypothetical protein
MQKNQLVRSLLVCAATCMLSTAAFAGENWVGSWKLNPAKSNFGSAAAVRGLTLTFEATPAGIKLTSDGTDPQGKPIHGGYVSKFDGKDVPWTGNPVADTACAKKVDESTYENIWKKDGKAVITAKAAVSKDGKTLTVTQTGTDPQGAAINSVMVYDRQ